jgi:hypothetical protein
LEGEAMRKYKLKIDLPFLPKGSNFYFDDSTDSIYGEESDGRMMKYSLRPELSGYLWLLLSDGNKYFKKL